MAWRIEFNGVSILRRPREDRQHGTPDTPPVEAKPSPETVTRFHWEGSGTKALLYLCGFATMFALLAGIVLRIVE